MAINGSSRNKGAASLSPYSDIVLVKYLEQMGEIPLLGAGNDAEMRDQEAWIGRAMRADIPFARHTLVTAATLPFADAHTLALVERNEQVARQYKHFVDASNSSPHVHAVDLFTLYSHNPSLWNGYRVSVREYINGPKLLCNWDKASEQCIVSFGRDFPVLEDTFTSSREELEKAYARVVAESARAREILITANLRIAVSIAKQYRNSQFDLKDLIQEANIGLMKAGEKFDYKRGLKFTTYATWWIRQQITRFKENENPRAIKIPIYRLDEIRKIGKHEQKFIQEYFMKHNEPPTEERINAELRRFFELDNKNLKKIQKSMLLMDSNSLDDLLQDGDSDTSLGEMYQFPVHDEEGYIAPVESPTDALFSAELREKIEDVLVHLTPREEKIVRMRYGIGEPMHYSLEEIGSQFGLTRERIRQIEIKALRKLRHKRTSHYLEEAR